MWKPVRCPISQQIISSLRGEMQPFRAAPDPRDWRKAPRRQRAQAQREGSHIQSAARREGGPLFNNAPVRAAAGAGSRFRPHAPSGLSFFFWVECCNYFAAAICESRSLLLVLSFRFRHVTTNSGVWPLRLPIVSTPAKIKTAKSAKALARGLLLASRVGPLR